MGAVRPPWITKEDFYRTPFNFCDRWCEWCHLTSICKVYREGENDRKQALREGKDPNSWEFTFEVMQENLKKVGEMIARDAKRLGIDLDQITHVTEKEYDEYIEEQERLREHPLQKFSNKWSDNIHSFLKKFTEVPIEMSLVVAIEVREILEWYHTLIPAKVYRALDSDKREKEYPEDWRSYDEKRQHSLPIMDW